MNLHTTGQPITMGEHLNLANEVAVLSSISLVNQENLMKMKNFDQS
jgi:hypothetical protein